LQRREAILALFLFGGPAMRWLLVLAAWLALASCESSRSERDLEARARAGDPGAACDLALRDLQRCAAARKDWFARPGSPRPQCMNDPLPADHQSYFTRAIETLPGPPERKELLAIINDGLALAAASLELEIAMQERIDSIIGIIADSCATLRS
jgi:hypothetical protein